MVNALIIILSLVFLGYGINSLFLPKNLRAYGMWLAPLLGTVLVVVVGAALSLSKIGVNENMLKGLGIKGYHTILLVSLLLLFYSFLERKKLRFISLHNVVLLFLFSFGVLLTPRVAASVELVHATEYFSERGVVEKLIAEKKLTSDDFQIGVPILMAFFAGVINTEIRQLLPILAKVYSGLLAVLVFILLKYTLFKRTLIAVTTTLLLVLLAGFSVFHFLNLAQIVFSSTLLVLLLLVLDSYRTEHEEKVSPTGEDLILGASLSSLGIINPAGFSTILAFLLAAVPVVFIVKREKKLWLKIGKMIVIAFILNPFIFAVALEAVNMLL